MSLTFSPPGAYSGLGGRRGGILHPRAVFPLLYVFGKYVGRGGIGDRRGTAARVVWVLIEESDGRGVKKVAVDRDAEVHVPSPTTMSGLLVGSIVLDVL